MLIEHFTGVDVRGQSHPSAAKPATQPPDFQIHQIHKFTNVNTHKQLQIQAREHSYWKAVKQATQSVGINIALLGNRQCALVCNQDRKKH